MKRLLMVVHIALCWLCLGQHLAHAAEGAASHYFPGFAGTFAVAVAPDPGPLFLNSTLLFGADADRAVLQGRVNAGLDIFAVYNLLMGLYTFEQPVLGARLAVGGFVPVAYARLEANLATPLGSVKASDSDFNLGDIGLIPAAFHWHLGNVHVKLAELIMAPSGHYDTADTVNVGRNYWSFDTSLAATWLNAKTGTEVSAVFGLMINTENTATDYRTGNEFHIDFMLNQFLSTSFALGFHGYYYRQLSGDSGAGATLGAFQGESVGIGPALLWIPQWGGGKLILSGKWLHDLQADNRFQADYGVLNIVVKF